MSESALTASFSAHAPACDGRRAYLVLGASCSRPLDESRIVPLHDVDSVSLGRASGATLQVGTAQHRLLLGLPDRWLSSHHVTLQLERGQWVLYDRDSKNGTFVGGRRVESAALTHDDVIEVGSTFIVFQSSIAERTLAAFEAQPEASRATLHEGLHRTWSGLERVARSELPILIRGETGTGKEVAARRVHRASGRPGPFGAINCGAIAASLAESELFGHRRGAFSGATGDRPGLIRAADGGTLFLDEVGELSLALQVKLLRVLQEREVLPVGETRAMPVDLRVIAASHRDLPELVKRGEFREDLLARLSGYAVELPPLRERVVDLGLLIRGVLRRQLGDEAERVEFEREALRSLYAHRWPQNVRELERALEVALALRDGDALRARHLPGAVAEQTTQHKAEPLLKDLARRAALPQPNAPLSCGPFSSDEELRALLRRLLGAHDGNISGVARQLGKDRVQVRRWCRRLALDVRQFRAPKACRAPVSRD